MIILYIVIGFLVLAVLGGEHSPSCSNCDSLHDSDKFENISSTEKTSYFGLYCHVCGKILIKIDCSAHIIAGEGHTSVDANLVSFKEYFSNKKLKPYCYASNPHYIYDEVEKKEELEEAFNDIMKDHKYAL